MTDAETVYTSVRDSCNNSVVIYHRVGSSDSLFYTPVAIGGAIKMGDMLDCTISEKTEVKLRETGVITAQK